MTIFGLGSDIIDISRIKRAFKNKNFKKKIFSKNEIKTSDSKSSKISSYAKKFAAKEAFSKALGTGISGGISFNEISIKNHKKGQPYIELLGKTKSIVQHTIKKRYKTVILDLESKLDKTMLDRIDNLI